MGLIDKLFVDPVALNGRIEIKAPVPGSIVSLAEVPAETFSEGLLGNGLAVKPPEGKIYAPFDGVCEIFQVSLDRAKESG